LQDLFNKFSNEVVELQSEIIDLGSDSLLTTEVVAPRLTRDFVSPVHTPD